MNLTSVMLVGDFSLFIAGAEATNSFCSSQPSGNFVPLIIN
jgi:hypothetical protein